MTRPLRIFAVLAITASALALSDPAWCGIPALSSPDALALPAGGQLTVTLPADTRSGAEKVSPLLRRSKTASPDGTVRVLVLLHEPLELSAKGRLAVPGTRTRLLARLEQDFVARTIPLGLEPIRGLSELPIVIARAAPGDLEAIAADPAVQAIDPDLPVHASRTEGAALMHADQLRTQYGGTGAGIGVAVLDTGIDVTHPELQGQVTAKGNYTDSPGDGTTDVPGHGTAVAGIIAGTDGGMAPAAHLWSLKVLDDSGSGSLTGLVSALNDVLANRNQFGGVSIVNMSLGGLGGTNGDQPWTGSCDSDIPTMATAVNNLVNAGITVFGAAGNEGCKNGIGWPSCLSNVISVGAVYDANLGQASFENVTCAAANRCTDSSTAAGKVSCYSNSGTNLDVWAPAHCARTTRTGGGYEYCFGGTSASSPYAAGVAAQLYGLVSGLTPAQLRSALTSTGTLVTDPGNGVAKHLVDAVAAYQQLEHGGGGGGDNVAWVEWAVHAAGSGGSQWRSDVGFLNKGSAPANVDFTFYLTDGRTIEASSTTTVAAGGQAWYEDILGQLGITGKGSVKVQSDQPGAVTARLYNQTSNGTYGQYFAGHTTSDGLASGESAVLPMLRQDSHYRTNLSVTNMGSSSATVSITLRNHVGTTVGVLSRTLSPGQSYQWVEPFASAGMTNDTGSAVVRVGSGSGVVASASVIDRRTNDPTTIQMAR